MSTINVTSELLKDQSQTPLYKKCICIVAFFVLAILIILYIYYKYYKDGYLTESVRSNSDRGGWDLRKSIEKYLKRQDSLLSKRIY